MFQVFRIIFAGYMVCLSVMDIRQRKLPVRILIAGAVFPAAACFTQREIPATFIAAGCAVGIVFVLISRWTRESFGYGDSILIMIMGAFLGFWNILSLLMAAFLMAAVYSVILMVKYHFNRKYSFPFVPFLTAAYIGGLVLECI